MDTEEGSDWHTVIGWPFKNLQYLCIDKLPDTDISFVSSPTLIKTPTLDPDLKITSWLSTLSFCSPKTLFGHLKHLLNLPESI